ncbi:hypothetical protein BDF14DRAFT_1867750 [Spinellus fusiger]|nr:hypothetical protein BDF14DRAFT_1867750 [Spinellus fusiger]
MNYLAMDRASDTAAHDLAEVRKLIEGMNALVNSQAIQQQQQQRQGQHPLTHTEPTFAAQETPLPTPTTTPAATAAATAAAAATTTAPRAQEGPLYSVPDIPPPTALPTNGTIIEVAHLLFNRTLYFQLTSDATIEPLITWLRVSFSDHSISGMVLQYKGFDGLWKCLLNRDDSLKRILKQSLKGQSMLQMRVPREEDLLSSGYTDRRLLALTKPGG